MSIIIASLDYDNKTVHIGSDRLQTTPAGEPVKDELVKLIQIKPDLYYCINGHVNNGVRLKNLLLESKYLNQKELCVGELIKIIESFVCVKGYLHGKLQGDCMFCLAGLSDDSIPFIYVRDTKAESSHILRAEQGKVMRIIACPCNETANKVGAVFANAVSKVGHSYAIRDSIIYAASIDKAIGSNFDYVSIKAPLQILDSYIAATGTLLVGDVTHNNAGIVGITDHDTTSVRFYAGSTYANKDTAPFRVQDDGHVFMSDADISGTVNATSGKISNWGITDAGLTNVTDTGDACIILNREYPSGNSDFVSLGIQEGTLFSSLLTSSNIEPKGVQNVGIEIEARNGTAPSGANADFASIALRARGTSQLNGPIWTLDNFGSAVKGVNQNVQYTRGSQQFTMIFQNGLCVGTVSGWI